MFVYNINAKYKYTYLFYIFNRQKGQFLLYLFNIYTAQLENIPNQLARFKIGNIIEFCVLILWLTIGISVAFMVIYYCFI